MRCDRWGARLAAAADGPDALEGDLGVHVSSCLRCQAELARQRRVRRELQRLDPNAVTRVDGLLEDIIATIDDRGEPRLVDLRGRRAVFTVVAAAGAAGAIVVANRARTRRLAG